MGDRLLRVLLLLGPIWVGGIAGLFLGGASVSRDAGLAGGAIVLGYGVMGAAAGLLIGGLLAWKVSAPALRAAFFVVLALDAAATAAVALQISRASGERQAREAREEAERTAPFTAAAIAHGPNDGATFVQIEVDGAAGTFVMTSRNRPGRPTCRGTIDEQARVRLLNALRRAASHLDEHPDACRDSGEPLRSFRWHLPERSGAARQEVVTSVACGAAHGELTALYLPFESIAFRGEHREGVMACEDVSATGAAN
jgi:hypothetical protein